MTSGQLQKRNFVNLMMSGQLLPQLVEQQLSLEIFQRMIVGWNLMTSGQLQKRNPEDLMTSGQLQKRNPEDLMISGQLLHLPLVVE
jgi:hypothetical protein